MTSSFVPNSYLTPNAFIDKLLHYLTPEEWVVLSYTCRHILGWQDRITSREAIISLNMLLHGFTTKKGERYNGCGLCKPTIIRALDELVRFHILEKVGNPTAEGQRWHIPADDSQIDYDLLLNRQNNQKSKSITRTEKARTTKLELNNSGGGQSDLPVSEIDHEWSVGLTGGGQSDLLNQIHIQNQDQDSANADSTTKSNLTGTQPDNSKDLAPKKSSKASEDKKTSETKARKRNDYFDAVLVRVCGGDLEKPESVEAKAPMTNKVVGFFKPTLPDLTKDEINAFLDFVNGKTNDNIRSLRDPAKWSDYAGDFRMVDLPKLRKVKQAALTPPIPACLRCKGSKRIVVKKTNGVGSIAIPCPDCQQPTKEQSS